MPTTWKEFARLAEPDLPECPRPLLEDAAKEFTRDFCRRSTVLRAWLPDQNLTEDVDEYTLVPPSDTQIVVPLYVEANQIPVTALDEEATDHASPFWRHAGGVTYRYHLLDLTTLKLTWLPDATVVNGLRVRAILEPTRTATGVDSGIFDAWAETIAAGIRSRCMRMPSKPWTSERWQSEAMAYKRGVNDAYAVANRGRTRRPMRVRMNPLARGGGLR